MGARQSQLPSVSTRRILRLYSDVWLRHLSPTIGLGIHLKWLHSLNGGSSSLSLPRGAMRATGPDQYSWRRVDNPQGRGEIVVALRSATRSPMRASHRVRSGVPMTSSPVAQMTACRIRPGGSSNLIPSWLHDPSWNQSEFRPPSLAFACG